ncbi:hypothetical protein MHC_06004 [Mycoplasma haemocanis str. Illinois]|uniref:Uncharacterized protein n=1 Tax=Mycoplasma haemocanis (strain Illinois) TaxID=1111676 RepID=I6RDJ9_MYCHN|nr:hypothetical protein MHC_06004 [Mycoplasma haemocanis str. Illinois]
MSYKFMGTTALFAISGAMVLVVINRKKICDKLGFSSTIKNSLFLWLKYIWVE